MATPMAEDTRNLPPKEDGNQYQFMIVDDSEFMVNNLKRIIASFGGNIAEVALDGEEAVAKYQAMAQKPDVITMDITMPKKNGLEATKEIMTANKAQKIVMVSALGQKDMVQQSILNGAKHFIVKPFKREDIYKVFKAVLGIKN